MTTKIANYEIIKRRPKDQGHYEIALGYREVDDTYATWERNCEHDANAGTEGWYSGKYNMSKTKAEEDFYTR